MNSTSQHFSSATIESLRSYIEDNRGNEITFLGTLDSDGMVVRVEPLTRGNIDSAPALLRIEGPGVVLIHNHPSGNLTPSDADIQVASSLGNNLVGFYIIDNEVSLVNVVVRPVVEKTSRLSSEALLKYLIPDHEESIARDIEERDAQKEMLTTVVDAFNNDQISIVEAGTGTGKTWAYLIPAMEWSERNEEKVVISTFTINLQEQIIEDFNYLNERIKKGALKISILKGRGNYLCRLRLDKLLNQMNLLLPEGVTPEHLKLLKEWAETSSSGTISDLTTPIPPALWEEVETTGDTCLKEKCPYYLERCFYYRSKKESLSSNIIVVNHHLTFADYFLKKNSADSSIIPEYRRIIFDEAHHVEDAFRNQLERTFSLPGLKRIVTRLYKHGKKQQTGLLPASLKFVDNELIYDSILQLSEMVGTAENHFVAIADLLSADREPETISSREFLKKKQIRKLIDDSEALIHKLQHLSETLEKIAGMVKEGDPLIAREIRSKSNRLKEYAEVLETFYFSEDSNILSILETNKKKGAQSIKFKIQPIEVSSELENFYSDKKTVIMTSATLSMDGNFDFFKFWSGLEAFNERIVEKSLPSPFDYDRQMEILIPTDIPTPDEAGFSVVASDFLTEALKKSRGRSFILFTSYRMLENFYAKIFPILDEEHFLLLKQGQLPRSKLIERFKQGHKAVLFGTDSFWEGVDVAGEKLSMVVITRLPFPVPTDPLYRARADLIRNSGGNEFFDYSLPIASLKLKQGIGRLIRNKRDRGIILILDKRLILKNYGKRILASLQSSNIIRGNREELLEEIESFLEDKNEDNNL